MALSIIGNTDTPRKTGGKLNYQSGVLAIIAKVY